MEEKELPKIDLPEDWVIGTDINKDLLNLYTHYPVRLKCEMFVLCLEGEVKALVNLNEIQVRPNDVITQMRNVRTMPGRRSESLSQPK